MKRNEKLELVSHLKENLLASGFIAIAYYRGMSDKQLYDMRVALKSKGCHMKIAKNTLVKVAIKGTDLEVLSKELSGPNVILYSQDPVSLAKVITDFAKEAVQLQIRAGYLNKSVINSNAISNLAKLGSLEEVRASFIGTIKGAQSNFVRILNAPSSGLASLLKNYASTKEE
jgi:large subunit ribosomal protein L10